MIIMVEPFANALDYKARGFDQGDWSTDVLNMRLAEASRKVRARARNVDDRIRSGDLDPDLVADIVCAMVSRAAPIDGGLPIPGGAETAQVSVDLFQQSFRFGSGGAAALYFTREERRTLGIGGSTVSSVDLLGPDSEGVGL